MSDSSLSIDSLLLAADDHLLGGTLTPEVARRSNPFNKAMGTLGYSYFKCTCRTYKFIFGLVCFQGQVVAKARKTLDDGDR